MTNCWLLPWVGWLVITSEMDFGFCYAVSLICHLQYVQGICAVGWDVESRIDEVCQVETHRCRCFSWPSAPAYNFSGPISPVPGQLPGGDGGRVIFYFQFTPTPLDTRLKGTAQVLREAFKDNFLVTVCYPLERFSRQNNANDSSHNHDSRRLKGHWKACWGAQTPITIYDSLWSWGFFPKWLPSRVWLLFMDSHKLFGHQRHFISPPYIPVCGKRPNGTQRSAYSWEIFFF
jgi:hypothetical protein